MAEDTQVQVMEPARKKKRAPQISRSRMDKAARELNMICASARGLESIGTMGQFIGELGLMKYGNGRLLGSAALMARSAQRCADMAEKEGVPDEARQAYLELQLRFLKALDANVALQLELNKVAERKAESADSGQTKSFLPGAQIAPIQVNVHATTATITESSKEDPCPRQS